MRAVVQRVSRASVQVGSELVGQIGLGAVVLLAVGRDDAEADADYLAQKIAGLRMFEDDAGKMNLSLPDVGGAVLAVSQFTCSATFAGANDLPSIQQRLPSVLANFMSTSYREFANLAWAVKPGVFKQRWNWN